MEKKIEKGPVATFRNNSSCQNDMSRQGIKHLFFFLFPSCREDTDSFFKQVKVKNQETIEVYWLDLGSIGDFFFSACSVLGFLSN